MKNSLSVGGVGDGGVEDYCLGGGFIRDGGADVILFKEVAKTGQ